MKKFLTISSIITLALVGLLIMAPVPVLAAQEPSSAESDIYIVSSDTRVTGLPMPAPEPPRPIAEPEPPVPIAPPEPIIIGAPRPGPEPTPPAWETTATTIAVERVLPCPPEPPAPIAPPEPPVPIAPVEPIVPEKPADEIIVAALPPRKNLERGCTIYCALEVDKIIFTIDSVEDLNLRLFVFDMISCRVEVLEPKAPRYFEVERPRGTRLFLAVFDSETVIYKITVWTPPSPSAP